MQAHSSDAIMIKDRLPRALTSYDLLKSLALILMVIDHLGVFFFFDQEWFRIIGRFSAPIWLFLIGYARTTEISNRIWVCAFIVLFSKILVGEDMFPLNILFTIIVIRTIRQDLVYRCFHSFESMRGMFFLLFFSVLFMEHVFEYVASGALIVLYGYMIRNPEEVRKNIDEKYVRLFALGVFVTYLLFQGAASTLTSYGQLMFLTAGISLIGFGLSYFKPVVFGEGRWVGSRAFVLCLQFFGRRSLEFYVLHILVFTVVSLWVYPERYNPLSWDFLPPLVVEFLALNGISM